MDQASQPAPSPQPLGGRGLSLLEFLIGGAIVVAHNVFHVVPNEVPILFVLAIASIRLREGSFRAIGLGRPESWWQTILIAAAAVVVLIVATVLVLEPLTQTLGLHAGKSAATALGLHKGDVLSELKTLGVAWTFAAFGEEIAYRRYILGRAAEAFGGTPFAYALALVFSSALFGIGHFYQGTAGMFVTASHGFIIGAFYLLSRRNLWVAVLTHGLFDTIVFVATFFGLAD
jgi:membrane protease YdiL (CAAX protease family)